MLGSELQDLANDEAMLPSRGGVLLGGKCASGGESMYLLGGPGCGFGRCRWVTMHAIAMWQWWKELMFLVVGRPVNECYIVLGAIKRHLSLGQHVSKMSESSVLPSLMYHVAGEKIL